MKSWNESNALKSCSEIQSPHYSGYFLFVPKGGWNSESPLYYSVRTAFTQQLHVHVQLHKIHKVANVSMHLKESKHYM